VRDQVSHPYKTTGRIMVLYILTFTFLDSRREDKYNRKWQAQDRFIFRLRNSVIRCQKLKIMAFENRNYAKF
jgi:hypothetical protein